MSNKDKDISGTSPLIIVADDDPSVRLMLHHILQKDQFNVLEALNGQEALKLTKKHKPDLVLLDAVMPEMDGFLCCKLIKELNPGIPVIIVTSLDDDHSVEHAFQVGADDYLTKPINWSVLKHRIAHTISHKQAAISEPSSNLEKNVSKHKYDLELNPRIELKNKTVICIDAIFNEYDNKQTPLLPQYSVASELSSTAIEKLMTYAFNKLKLAHESNSNYACLSLPLLPYSGTAEEYKVLIEKIIKDTRAPLKLIEMYVGEVNLMDKKTLAILDSIQQLKIKLSIKEFSFSLNTISLLNELSYDSLQLSIAQVKNNLSIINTELIKQMLAPYLAEKVDIIAREVNSEEDFNLAVEIGCTQASGTAIDKYIET